MSESDLSKAVFSIINDGGGHACRVESPLVTPGFPDIDFCIDGHMGQIELKFQDFFTYLHIRPAQYRWHKQRQKAGGRTFFLAEFCTENSHLFVLINGNRIQKLESPNDPSEWMKHKIASWNRYIAPEDFIYHLTREL